MFYVIKNTHFWSNIDMFLFWLDSVDKGFEKQNFNTDYIRKGFENAVKEGYDMKKIRRVPNHDVSRMDKRRKKDKKTRF